MWTVCQVQSMYMLLKQTLILARTLEQGYCVPVFHHTRHGPVEIKTVERQQHIHSNELLDLHPDGSDLSGQLLIV